MRYPKAQIFARYVVQFSAATFLFLAALLDFVRCTIPLAPPNVPPAPSAAAGAPSEDVYDRACATLAAVGCPEAGSTCASTMRADDLHRMTAVRAACIAGATTADGVRACGPYVRCEP